MERKIKPMYDLGETVTLLTDAEHLERVVVAIIITYNGLLYRVRQADYEPTEHTAIEIEKPKNEKDT